MMNEHQVDHTLCAAGNCPMLATSKRERDWMCFIHVAARPDDWNAISNELNRLSWLVDSVKRLRAGSGPNTCADISKAIKLAQRMDLLCKRNESNKDWYIRLEQALADSCATVCQKEVAA
jgi:hypothetical protein